MDGLAGLKEALEAGPAIFAWHGAKLAIKRDEVRSNHHRALGP
jgi:hypothetical protein